MLDIPFNTTWAVVAPERFEHPVMGSWPANVEAALVILFLAGYLVLLISLVVSSRAGGRIARWWWRARTWRRIDAAGGANPHLNLRRDMDRLAQDIEHLARAAANIDATDWHAQIERYQSELRRLGNRLD